MSSTKNNYWNARIANTELDNGLLIKDNAIVGCRTWVSSVIIPEYITSIGNAAFRHCSKLSSITIPEGVTSIGNGAFYGCSALTSVNIPESVTSIEGFAFFGCSALTSVNISEGVTRIDVAAFYECSALTSITIPESVTGIWEMAFENCPNLTDVIIFATTPPNPASSFTTYGTLHVLPGCKAAYEAANAWNKFTIVEDAGVIPEDDDAPKYATFDFTDPENLNPAIEPGEEEDDYVNIATKTFNEKHVELTLDKGSRTQSYGSRIYTNEGYTYNVRVYSGATLEFAVSTGNSSSISSITFEGDNIDNFTASTGTYEDGVWTGSAQTVKFTATGTNNIDKITVEYLYDDAIILTDAEEFENDEEMEDVTIKYRRNFTDTNWQPLFIPFAPAYADWSEDFEVARLNAFYEFDEQGESQKKIEFILIKDEDAVLKPNHPYFIRAKEAGQKTIKSEHATLYTSDANEFDDLTCSTAETNFEIKGTYSNDESIFGKYYVSKGMFWLDETGYNSRSYRWFISSESKGAQYNHAGAESKTRSISVSVIGCEDATSIIDVDSEPSVDNNVKYALDGRIINGEPVKGTMFIMNGRKYIKH